MKNLKLFLLSMCALVFMAMGVQAQSGFLKRASDSKTTDTLVNAATSNVQLGIAGFQNTIALQFYGTKLTGTTAATARLYASLDGVSYERIPSVKADGTVGIDSLILTNVAGVQSKTFKLTSGNGSYPAYAYYQVRTIGTGTQTTKIQTYAIWRKE